MQRREGRSAGGGSEGSAWGWDWILEIKESWLSTLICSHKLYNNYRASQSVEKSIKKSQLIAWKRGDLDELTYVLLHSPIRDVYLCIQGFDSRLACRICNNTVQSSIRAEGLSVHRETVERIRDMRGKNYGRGKDEREKDKTRKSCQWPHMWISLGTNRATPKLWWACVCGCTDLVVCVRGSVISGFIARMTGFEPSLEVAEGVIICQH